MALEPTVYAEVDPLHGRRVTCSGCGRRRVPRRMAAYYAEGSTALLWACDEPACRDGARRAIRGEGVAS